MFLNKVDAKSVSSCLDFWLPWCRIGAFNGTLERSHLRLSFKLSDLIKQVEDDNSKKGILEELWMITELEMCGKENKPKVLK